MVHRLSATALPSALLILAVLLVPSVAWSEDSSPTKLGRAITIEQPPGGVNALAAFHDALRETRARKGRARLLFYGDSHIARDHYTGQLRRRLQKRFGNAGAGFAPLALPFEHYRHQELVVASAQGWHRVRPHGAQGPPDAYGLAGIAHETLGEAVGSIEPKNRFGRVSRFDVLYFGQPSGGSFEVRIDSGEPRRVSTASAKGGAGFERITMRDGSHHIEVKTLGDGPVRVYGASVERMRPGVIIDTLGIPGARARDQLPWGVEVQRAQLRRLAPHLVVLAYGTNESFSERYSMAQYERELHVIVDRMRKALPRSSCLLIGPTDLPVKASDGTYGPRDRQLEIVAIQRRIAAKRGCGFVDLIDFMGGLGSMNRWVAHEPPFAREDHTHLTKLGHERLAEQLEAALLKGL